MRLALIILVACQPAHPTTTPAPIETLAKHASCRLPEPPAALGPAVGYPDESHVVLSKGDWAVLSDYLELERQWIEAATLCLERP